VLDLRKSKSRLVENVEAVVLAIIIALVFRTFAVENYMVPTESMYPTIEIGDRLFALKFFYGAKMPFTSGRLPAVRDPRHGDIVVFLAPYYEDPSLLVRMVDPFVHIITLGFITVDRQPKYYVKRVIGLPGDEVEIVGKRVYVNGKRQEGWWPEYHADKRIVPAGEKPANRRDYFEPVVVPERSYFVMGDNRDSSFDSRYWGFVDRNEIYGRAYFRLWPITRAGVIR
jgi:signal peptidase I